MSSNPFLSTEFHINWPALKPEMTEEAVNTALKTAEDKIKQISGMTEPADWENTAEALEIALEKLFNTWGKVVHLDTVKNSPELREAYNALLPKISDFTTALYLNRDLYRRFKELKESEAYNSLNDIKKRYINETLLDFEENGAALNDNDMKQLEEINRELSAKTQKFSENVLDSTNAYELIVSDPERVKGLPESALEAAREDALAKGHGSKEKPAWRFTLQAPSLIAVLQYADDASLREEIYRAAQNVGAGDVYDNTGLIIDILQLRQRKAELLGFKDFAEMTTRRRMAGSGSQAEKFINDLYEKIKDGFDKEQQQLQQFIAEQTGTEPSAPEPWDVTYYAEKQRQKLYDFDEEEVRPYFAVDNVLNGMFELVSRLYGISITEKQTSAESADRGVPVWHEDVRFFEINDADRHLGSFYIDLHPREEKRGGAWMNHLLTGGPKPDGSFEPHLGLFCGNMTPPAGGKPALLRHSDVETLFHEFGHLLHHLLGEVEIKSMNGTNVVWDFVELPSQIMENFCWQKESLDLFAEHFETGEKLPEELLEKMLRARNYNSAMFDMRQLSFGRMDLALHRTPEKFNKENLDSTLDELLTEYKLDVRTDFATNVRRFHHLFSDPVGYAAGYYSYKWAEVLDADAFTRFQENGVISEQTGREFREKLLSKGNSRPADELFRDFMGRDPSPDAMLKRAGHVN